MSDHKENEIYDVVIIGCGDIAGGYDENGGQTDSVLTHAGAYKAHSGFRIVACIDPDQNKRQSFMAHWSVAQGFDDVAGFKSSAIHADVASVCVPTDLHVEVLTELLHMPVRAIFCEKPITDNKEDTQALIDAFARKGTSVSVNYFRRYILGLEQLRHDIQSGAWGALQNGVGQYCKGVLNCGSHMIDLIHYLVGDVKLKAVTKRQENYLPSDPTLDACLYTQNGAALYLVGGDHHAFFHFELVLTFENGQVCIEDLGRSLRVRPSLKDPEFPDRTTLSLGETTSTQLGKAMVCAVDNLHDHLVNNAPLLSDGQSARSAENICHDMIALSESLRK